MEFEVSYTLENEQQFWDELDDIVSTECQSHELIDNALRSYLSFTTSYMGEYIQSEYDFARCSYKLLESTLFATNKDYVRRQIVYSVLQEDSPDTLHLIIAFLLFDGRQNEATFEMMNEEGVLLRLLELIQERKDDDAGLHRMLLELLYEMSRIQRLRTEDLILIDDKFIAHMFQIIEGLSDDVNDPYHYPVIRVLLILNEQYMVSAHTPPPPTTNPVPTAAPPPLPNKVVTTLSAHGSTYKTFGENLILLLNRESETSLQLLILKLLYLLFTSPPTYEYFYTNDLHVLLDIILRNLLDLPPGSIALRHTYLRVLYPLLGHTQLKYPPHYKRAELQRLLAMMSGGGIGTHFGEVDETTTRLVGRCANVSWLLDEDDDSLVSPKVKQRFLSVAMPGAMESSLSVVEVAAQTEAKGVKTPSRGLEARVADSSVGAVGGAKAKGTGDVADAGVSIAVKGVATNGDGFGVGVEKSPFEVEGEA